MKITKMVVERIFGTSAQWIDLASRAGAEDNSAELDRRCPFASAVMFKLRNYERPIIKDSCCLRRKLFLREIDSSVISRPTPRKSANLNPFTS